MCSYAAALVVSIHRFVLFPLTEHVSCAHPSCIQTLLQSVEHHISRMEMKKKQQILLNISKDLIELFQGHLNHSAHSAAYMLYVCIYLSRNHYYRCATIHSYTVFYHT